MAGPKISRDLPARFIVRKNEKQFFAAVAQYAVDSGLNFRATSEPRNGAIPGPQPRCCVGLFAAADALGFGFVRGVSPHLYLERLDFDVLRKLARVVC